MPRKFTGGGNKKRRGGKRHNKSKTYSLDDLIPSNDDNQSYAYVSQKYGDGRYSIMCYDKVTRMGIVAGRLKKSSRIDKGHLVLVSLRDYQDDRCDIIYHYTDDDIDKLINSNNLNSGFVKSGTLTTEDNTITIGQSVSSNTVNDTLSNGSSDSDKLNSNVWNSDEEILVNENSKEIINDIKEDYGEINIDDL